MVLTAGEIFFIDTNVLLTATDDTRKHHSEVKKLFKSAIQAGFYLAFSGQVIREYLVVIHQLKGKRIHDANIVATMKTHGIKYLITDNSADFKFFKDVETFKINETLEIIK